MGDMTDFVHDWDPDGPLYGPGGDLSCKYCGESGLHWKEVFMEDGNAWRLFDEENCIHSCEDRGKMEGDVDRSLGFDWSSLKKKESK